MTIAEQTYTVKKPFNTTSQRWAAGAAISRTDDLTPHSFDDFLTRGFIAEVKVEAAKTETVFDMQKPSPDLIAPAKAKS